MTRGLGNLLEGSESLWEEAFCGVRGWVKEILFFFRMYRAKIKKVHIYLTNSDPISECHFWGGVWGVGELAHALFSRVPEGSFLLWGPLARVASLPLPRSRSSTLPACRLRLSPFTQVQPARPKNWKFPRGPPAEERGRPSDTSAPSTPGGRL